MTTTPPLDLDAIQARANAATPGPWYFQPEYGPEFIAAEVRGYEHGIGNLEFGAGSQARADREFVIAAREAVPALLAEVRRLTAELARYVGHEPTIAEEMAHLSSCLDAVHAVCDRAEKQATRWEHPLPVPEWVATVRAAANGETNPAAQPTA